MSAWQIPEGCRAKSKMPGDGSAPAKGGHKGQGGKKQGGDKDASGKGGGKRAPSRQQQQSSSRRGNGRSQGGGRAAENSAGSMLATIQALAKIEPLLSAFGLTGKGKGRSGGQGSAGKQPMPREAAPSPSGEVVVRNRQSRRCRDQHPEKPVLLAGTKKQATLVRPDTGEIANIVSVCTRCHWPY